jgi:hypothetical protein
VAKGKEGADLRAQVTELLSDRIEGPFPASAVAENAITCVVYALEVEQTGAAQASVWAARQLYDAADSLVQASAPVHTYVDHIDQEAPVRLFVLGISETIDVLTGGHSADLIARAREDGETFLSFLTHK